MKQQWQCQNKTKIKAKKGFGRKRHNDIFHFFSSASKKVQMEATRLHVQLLDGIYLWFSLNIFSHWVIQSYNMHAALVVQIPKGIIIYLFYVHVQLQWGVVGKASNSRILCKIGYLSLNIMLPLFHYLLSNLLIE